MSLIAAPHLWKGIQTPDFFAPLSDNLEVPIGSVGNTTGIFTDGLGPATPNYTIANRVRGIQFSGTTGRANFEGDQHWSGLEGSGCLWFVSTWDGDDATTHVIHLILPINTFATSYLLIQKSSVNSLGIWFRWAAGGAGTKSANFAVNSSNFPANTPHFIGWWWGGGDIGITLNINTYAATSSVTMGDATVTTPTMKYGSGNTHNSPCEGLIASPAVWKKKHDDTEIDTFWANIYSRQKALHGRDV